MGDKYPNNDTVKVPVSSKQQFFHDFISEWYINPMAHEDEESTLDGLSCLITVGGKKGKVGKEQDRHVDLMKPHKQAIISCNKKAPSPIIYEPVPMAKQITNLNGVFHLWTGYHARYGDTCGFPDVQALWVELYRIVEQVGLEAVMPFLRDYSSTLFLPCDLVIKQEFKDTFLDVGDAVVIGSNCLHNAPGTTEGRVVLFTAIRNTPKASLPWKSTDNDIDPDIQWTAPSLFPPTFEKTCCLLTHLERHTLLTIFGWYLVLGMCQGNPLGDNYKYFPLIQSYIKDLEKLYKTALKGVLPVSSGRDFFNEDGTAKEFAKTLFLGIPNIAITHTSIVNILESVQEETPQQALKGKKTPQQALKGNKRPRTKK